MTEREALTLAFAALTHIQDNYMTLPEIGEQALAAVDEVLEKPQRTWVGLTDEEIDDLWDKTVKYAPSEVRIKDFAQAVEAKLKEKNT